jgi:hypothetical protein
MAGLIYAVQCCANRLFALSGIFKGIFLQTIGFLSFERKEFG